MHICIYTDIHLYVEVKKKTSGVYTHILMCRSDNFNLRPLRHSGCRPSACLGDPLWFGAIWAATATTVRKIYYSMCERKEIRPFDVKSLFNTLSNEIIYCRTSSMAATPLSIVPGSARPLVTPGTPFSVPRLRTSLGSTYVERERKMEWENGVGMG